MHTNRSLYSLTEYQSKLRRNYLNLGVVIEKTNKGTFSIFRPVPATPWLPEGRKKYFRKLQSKIKATDIKNKYTFCTLTYSTRFHDPTSCARRVKRDLDLFFKRLSYRKSKPEYFYVIELTDKMMTHVHLVFDRFVHKKKIFTSWNKITNSICTKIKYLPGQHAMYYCAKYLTSTNKQPHGKWAFLFKNIDRLWSSSRKFFADPEQLEKNYRFLFMLWNKNEILSEYFPNKEILSNQGDLQENDVGLLEHDAVETDCIIDNKKAGPGRLLASIALTAPAQQQFDFFEKSLWNY